MTGCRFVDTIEITDALLMGLLQIQLQSERKSTFSLSLLPLALANARVIDVCIIDQRAGARGRESPSSYLYFDADQAKVEFGEVMASYLKLSPDGLKVLWPQPANDPNTHKIASIFGLAQTYDTTSGVINNVMLNWSIFLLGWGGIFWVMLMRHYGQLPVLF
ncbi:uncharacterized protein EDB93DRAFT_1281974 [Suillus bovinus]|uniref:uncharacterized protein n=1 Tax=Suillus bovinus TaxID=48563 RepID=UPI001B880798|nr:uncharacterized protein EDB93DRAFT_1281974 [Suillus bovinus]KAG2147390.1 hypothetical protein EDB93DRAFT_1281974 [Suillus bovinus]